MRIHQTPGALFIVLATLVPALSLTACNTMQEQQAKQTEQSPTEILASALPSPPVVEEPEPPTVETPASEPTTLITGKQLHTVQSGDSESPRNDGIHDSTNAAIDMLQDPRQAMKDFPRDRRQQVDWVKALDKELIKPRIDIEGKTEQMMVLEMDILMKNTQFMPWVKFPHKAHTQWLACDNCHPAIFEMKEGANPITMNKVLRGEYCGVCHDRVAFSLFTCERCHSVPHEGSGKKWW
jgi:c(7)-type cytochrome triheme protein